MLMASILIKSKGYFHVVPKHTAALSFPMVQSYFVWVDFHLGAENP